MNNIDYVSLSGCYWTGSSAVLDLIREHDSCVVTRQEFCAFSYGQLFEAIRKFDSQDAGTSEALEEALTRFIRFQQTEPRLVFAVLRRLFSMVGLFPKSLFYFRMSGEAEYGADFVRASNAMISHLRRSQTPRTSTYDAKLCSLMEKVLSAVAVSERRKQGTLSYRGDPRLVAVYDQFVSPPYACAAASALPNLKFLVVDRDWRDQYVEMAPLLTRLITVNRALGVSPWGEDWSNFNSPIEFFLELRQRIAKYKGGAGQNANQLWVQFEDLVADTSGQADKIFEFLKVPSSGWRRDKYFRAVESARNVGIWETSKYRSDIEIMSSQIVASPG